MFFLIILIRINLLKFLNKTLILPILFKCKRLADWYYRLYWFNIMTSFSNAIYAIIRRRNYSNTSFTIFYLLICLSWAILFASVGFYCLGEYENKLDYLKIQNCTSACGNINYFTFNISCYDQMCCSYDNTNAMVTF